MIRVARPGQFQTKASPAGCLNRPASLQSINLIQGGIPGMSISYNIEDEPIVIHKSIIDKFLKKDKPGDLIALYLFYYYTAKWQKTNQPKATTGYSATGLKWTENRIRKAKQQLIEIGLIEDIQTKDNQNKVTGHYIKVKFIWSQNKTEEIKSHPNDFPQGGFDHSVEKNNPNALSSNSLNALSSLVEISKFSGNWKKESFPAKYKYIHSNYPKIPRSYLQYAIEYQEKKLEKFASLFQSNSDEELIDQIINSCDTLDKLVRIDKYYFLETIVPALKWASKDKFWNSRILSLASFRKKNKDKEMKFAIIHNRWCEAEDIDPKKGRYVLESEVIFTPAVNPKWTEYLNAKRKEQGIETDAVPEGLSQEGFEEFFKQKGTVTI